MQAYKCHLDKKNWF